MGIAQLTRTLQIGRIVHAHATGALQPRLQDHRADFTRMLVEQRGQAVGGLARAVGRTLPGLGQVGVGRGREQAFGQQRRIDAAIQRDVGQCEGTQRLAVVAVLQRDEARAPGLSAVLEVLEGHLQCHFDAGRAIVGVEHLGQRRAAGLARREGQQAFSQGDRRFMAEAGQHHLLQLSGLGGDGTTNARLGVAEQVGPPAADGVQVAVAVVIDQPGAFATGDRHQRQRVRMLAHLRARVPQHLEVALPPVLDQRRGGWVC
ncbi:hypothetical protein D3C72_1130260 [compost metagenome]